MYMKRYKWIILLNLRCRIKRKITVSLVQSGKEKISKQKCTRIPSQIHEVWTGWCKWYQWLQPALRTCLISAKKLSIHVSEKNICHEILSQNPVPRNIKSSQKLDEYINEPSLESQENSTPDQEKILKFLQEKFVTILDPLSKILECYGNRKRCIRYKI